MPGFRASDINSGVAEKIRIKKKTSHTLIVQSVCWKENRKKRNTRKRILEGGEGKTHPLRKQEVSWATLSLLRPLQHLLQPQQLSQLLHWLRLL
jgi:hypothetical protein